MAKPFKKLIIIGTGGLLKLLVTILIGLPILK